MSPVVKLFLKLPKNSISLLRIAPNWNDETNKLKSILSSSYDSRGGFPKLQKKIAFPPLI